MILLDHKTVKVEFNKSVPAVIWTPLEYITGDDFRKPLELALDYFVKQVKEFSNTGWICDSAQCKAVRPDDVIWVVQNINPAYAKAGGKKVAFVLPEDPFAKIALRLYIQYTRKAQRNSFEIKVFKTLNDSRLWIRGANLSSMEEVKM